MMNRRAVLAGVLSIGAAAGYSAAFVPPHRLEVAKQLLLDPTPAKPGHDPDPFAEAENWAARLIAAAESQIGRTVRYNPAYVAIPYPGGDVPPDRGVCTDVIIRAYREGLATDLQKLVHEDMRTDFAAYPRRWGLTRPDRNIDHRRVPNLETYFTRAGAALPVTPNPADYRPGDIVTMMLSGRLPHIALVTHRANADRSRSLLIHNIGAGARLEDVLFTFDLHGHFRFKSS